MNKNKKFKIVYLTIEHIFEQSTTFENNVTSVYFKIQDYALSFVTLQDMRRKDPNDGLYWALVRAVVAEVRRGVLSPNTYAEHYETAWYAIMWGDRRAPLVAGYRLATAAEKLEPVVCLRILHIKWRVVCLGILHIGWDVVSLAILHKKWNVLFSKIHYIFISGR